MTAPEAPKWLITIFREPQEKPFDHRFSLTAQCGCAWVARSLDAALRLVDVMEFYIAHPELPPPDGALGIHVQHAGWVSSWTSGSDER